MRGHKLPFKELVKRRSIRISVNEPVMKAFGGLRSSSEIKPSSKNPCRFRFFEVQDFSYSPYTV